VCVMAAPTVEEVLSIVGTSALAVTCCGTVPTCSVKFMAIAAAGLIAMPSRISVWNRSFSIRTVYFPVGRPTKDPGRADRTNLTRFAGAV
jgi:hypothetical protein